MTTPEQPSSSEPPNGPEALAASGPTVAGGAWYTWQRWKYIGGTLFIVLWLTGTAYAVWDLIDISPRPGSWQDLRSIIRPLPGQLSDVTTLAGILSFGVPAGVDLMLGATKAVEEWAQKRRAKARAEGKREGRQEGRLEEREEIVKRFRSLSDTNPDVKKLLDEIQNQDRND